MVLAIGLLCGIKPDQTALSSVLHVAGIVVCIVVLFFNDVLPDLQGAKKEEWEMRHPASNNPSRHLVVRR